MRIISTIMNFYWSHPIALQKLSDERSYKFSWILTLTEVISIRILRMRIISTIMKLYWSHAIPLQKLSNEHSYKFSWILTLTEVISIKNLKFFARLKKWRPVKSANAAEPKRHIKKLFATTDRQTTDETAFQYSRLWVNKVFRANIENIFSKRRSSGRHKHTSHKILNKKSQVYNWIHSSYFAVIFFTSVNLFLYGRCCIQEYRQVSPLTNLIPPYSTYVILKQWQHYNASVTSIPMKVF